MCGIAGVRDLGPTATVQRTELEAMIALLQHRGPDATGFYLGHGVGLANARLSIMDPAGGQQPLRNETGDVWVVCNGEIFNHRELRAGLVRGGHRFRTGSDCEVIVHLYEEHGLRFVEHLNGQFAIALWDAVRRRLVLVRDRVGILPLFYCQRRGRLLFASEIKALLPLFDAAPRPNLAALDQIFTFWAPLSPNTLFEGVFELEPGTLLVVQNGKTRTLRYWDWQFPKAGDWLPGSESELGEQLHDLLVEATRLRLQADVPIGAYLSGGLDSSTLVALASRERRGLASFGVAFDDGAFDESGFQGLAAKHLGTEHTIVHCRPASIAARFPETIWRTELPLLRTAPVPMSMLSQRVHEQGYKAVLTGEGADEVLGGYDLFKEAKIRRFWARQPRSRWRPGLLKRLYPYLDLGSRQSQAYLEQFFGLGIDDPEQAFFSHLPRWSTTARCKIFFGPALVETCSERTLAPLAQRLPPQWRDWHPFNRAQYLEAKTLLSGYLLSSQGDRMLMAHAVEGRFPYLDHRLIEFAARLEPRLKMKALAEKHLLKMAVAPYLPPAILQRPKQPYRALDAGVFFAEPVPEYVQQLLSPRSLHAYGYFDPARVSLLLRKVRCGRAVGNNDSMALVGILSTQLWHHFFIEGFYGRFRGASAGLRTNRSCGGIDANYAEGQKLYFGELPVHHRPGRAGR